MYVCVPTKQHKTTRHTSLFTTVDVRLLLKKCYVYVSTHMTVIGIN